jgi:3-hydroxyisobutyrate dehydrogenase-like beta-hydroxyacid dehydrogenase
MTPRIGLIGVGEAGAAIASGLRDEHGLTVAGYDARGDDPAVRARAQRAGVELVSSLAELTEGADVVVCLASAKVAVPVAKDAAPHLTARHLYADWNSASPEVKREVGEVLAGSGAAYVDGAVMAAVPPKRHRVPTLLSGPGAERLAAELTPYGFALEVLGSEPGQASAVKMFRSLLVKGLEALLLECAVGAQAYGATHRVLESMNGTLPTEDWPRLAAYLLERTVEHGERRAEELRQVARTLEDAGVEPLLADAGARRLQWFVDLGVSGDVKNLDYQGVLDAVQKAGTRTRS